MHAEFQFFKPLVTWIESIHCTNSPGNRIHFSSLTPLKTVQFGKSTLLQNVLESLDPSSSTVLNKNTVKPVGADLIKIDWWSTSTDLNSLSRRSWYITWYILCPWDIDISKLCLETAGPLGTIARGVRKKRQQLEELKNQLATSFQGKTVELGDELLRLLSQGTIITVVRKEQLQLMQLQYQLVTSFQNKKGRKLSLGMSFWGFWMEQNDRCRHLSLSFNLNSGNFINNLD